MSTFRLSLLVVGPMAAVVVAAACSPKVRPNPAESGGAGGGSSTTLSGVLTTGAAMTTGTDATTSGMPSTSSGPCPDTQTDPANCGMCGHDCSVQPNAGTATCSAGVCAFSCAGGYLDCNVGAEDGCETDPVNDAKNCNGCGTVCGVTQTCTASSCTDTFTSCAMLGTCPDPACEELNRFSVDAEVAVDLMNGRTLWERLSKGPIDFPTATDYCATRTLGGVSGWRLPTLLELSAIVYGAGGQDGCGAPNCNPALDQAVFAESFADDYWTSDPDMANGHYCLSFCTGFQISYTTSEHYVRCVHDPLP